MENIDRDGYIDDCQNCGASICGEQNIIEMLGNKLTYKCPVCHSVFMGLFTPGFDGTSDERDYRLTISWGGSTPDVLALKAIRSLLPEFRQLSVVEAKNRLKDKTCLVLDDLLRGIAIDLADEARKLGLEAEYTPITPSDPE